MKKIPLFCECGQPAELAGVVTSSMSATAACRRCKSIESSHLSQERRAAAMSVTLMRRAEGDVRLPFGFITQLDRACARSLSERGLA